MGEGRHKLIFRLYTYRTDFWGPLFGAVPGADRHILQNANSIHTGPDVLALEDEAVPEHRVYGFTFRAYAFYVYCCQATNTYTYRHTYTCMLAR